MSKVSAILKKLNTIPVEILLGLLLLVIVLRIPNFFEPYWYGDEAIYLTIGNALNNGVKLYSQIIDHKTPLIYYLAMVPDQFSFRLLLLGWMLVTTSCFYYLAYQLFKRLWPTAVATFFFIIFTTFPWYEGHIPNGELFVMGFVLAGATVLWQAKTTRAWLQEKMGKQPYSEPVILMAAGALFGLGILTKVPALFDLVAFLGLGWFGLVRGWFKPSSNRRQLLLTFIRYVSLLVLGAAIMIGLSIIYFVARGSGQAYLDFGLLYNFRYAGSWVPTFPNAFIASLFTLKGKVALLAVFGLVLTILTKWLSPKFLFVVMWLMLSLLAATLSNRPYPHYFLQLVPAGSLLVGWVVQVIIEAQQVKKDREVVKKTLPFFLKAGVLAVCLILVTQTLSLLQVYTYDTNSYYMNFWKLIRGNISYAEYSQTFNGVIEDNNKVAEILKEQQENELFIWGTNPILYAQTKTIPTSRFTVAFHIKDFDAYDETMTHIRDKQPEYIVVMNDEKDSFPELNSYLNASYTPNSNFKHLTLWKKYGN